MGILRRMKECLHRSIITLCWQRSWWKEDRQVVLAADVIITVLTIAFLIFLVANPNGICFIAKSKEESFVLLSDECYEYFRHLQQTNSPDPQKNYDDRPKVEDHNQNINNLVSRELIKKLCDTSRIDCSNKNIRKDNYNADCVSEFHKLLNVEPTYEAPYPRCAYVRYLLIFLDLICFFMVCLNHNVFL